VPVLSHRWNRLKGLTPKIKLDHHSIGIRDKDLEKFQFGPIPRFKRNAGCLQPPSQRIGFCCLKGNVVDDACLVTSPIDRGAIQTQMNLSFSVNAKPVAGKRKGWSWHQFKSKPIAIKPPRLLKVMGPDKIVMEINERHPVQT
jgi:hypothetical protein